MLSGLSLLTALFVLSLPQPNQKISQIEHQPEINTTIVLTIPEPQVIPAPEKTKAIKKVAKNKVKPHIKYDNSIDKAVINYMEKGRKLSSSSKSEDFESIRLEVNREFKTVKVINF